MEMEVENFILLRWATVFCVAEGIQPEKSGQEVDRIPLGCQILGIHRPPKIQSEVPTPMFHQSLKLAGLCSGGSSTHAGMPLQHYHRSFAFK